MVAFRKSVPVDRLISWLDTHVGRSGAYVGHLGSSSGIFPVRDTRSIRRGVRRQHNFETNTRLQVSERRGGAANPGLIALNYGMRGG